MCNEGVDLGVLNVYVSSKTTGEYVIFSRSGTQSNNWMQTFVQLNSDDFKSDLKLIVEYATRSRTLGLLEGIVLSNCALHFFLFLNFAL